jgi:hypothetical protein
VDLAVAEVCGLLDQRVDVFVVEHVAGDGEGLATVLVDGVCDALRLLYNCVSVNQSSSSAPFNAEYQELYGLHRPRYAHTQEGI